MSDETETQPTSTTPPATQPKVAPPSGPALLARAAEERAALAAQAEAAYALPLRRSDALGNLAGALALAQGEISNAQRDSKNPFFKSKYASLASTWEACRTPLAKNGLAVLQPVTTRGRSVIVTTLLVHASGEWIEERLILTSKEDTPQALGSVITYGRRYGLGGMVGVAPADDDGEAATHDVPRGVRWDKANTSLQQAAVGATDELGDEPEPSEPSPAAMQAELLERARRQDAAISLAVGPEPLPSTSTAVQGQPATAGQRGGPDTQQAPKLVTPPPATGRPVVARPKPTVTAGSPAGVGGIPPPPGMKPPQRAPTAEPIKSEEVSS